MIYKNIVIQHSTETHSISEDCDLCKSGHRGIASVVNSTHIVPFSSSATHRLTDCLVNNMKAHVKSNLWNLLK